jgi:hypothetical protein
MNDKIAEGLAFSIVIFLVIMILASLGHCAISKPHSNSLGVPMYKENPLMYQAGSFVTTSDAASVVDGNLNVRIRPISTYMLFDEAILFCGVPTEKFDGVTEPFVLTYRRQASRSVRGIGCHELVRVDSIKEKRIDRVDSIKEKRIDHKSR